MKTVTSQSLQDLYEKDFCHWAEKTANILRSQDWDGLDLEHLIEEVLDLSKSQQRSLQSALRLILSHLLKWKYQSNRRSRSWEVTITRERLNLEELLQESPSLRRFLEDAAWIDTTYQRSRREAMVETGLAAESFPVNCPFRLVEILDLDFYPES